MRSGRWILWATVALVAVSTIVRFATARSLDAPWIAPDETIYALLGRSLWTDGSLSLPGADTAFVSLVYPALIGLPLTLFGPAAGLAAVQAVQALVMSCVALVVYLWGRQVMDAPWALVAATLSVLIPGLSYSGLVMSETVFYLVISVALWLLWRTLMEPSAVRQAVLLAAVSVALLTRVQAVGLIPGILVAIVLHRFFTRDASVVRRLRPTIVALTLGCAVAVAASAFFADWNTLLGTYAAAAGGYDAGAATADLVWHLAGAFLVVAGIPLLALALCTLECARGRESVAAAALVATAVSWTLATVLEVGIFASRWVDHVAERELLTIAPPVFLVFGLWLARGAPRPQPVTSVLALLLVTPPLLLPLDRFAIQEAALDAFTFIPLWRLRESTSLDTLQLSYMLGVAALIATAVLVPRRARLVLPLFVAATLAATSVIAARELDRLTAADRTWVFGTTDVRWIDRVHNARPVTYIQAGAATNAALAKTLYWNESVERVLGLSPLASPSPLVPLVVEPADDGVLSDSGGATPRADYAVAPAGMVLAGEPLASYGPAADLPGLTLWRVHPPLRVRWMVYGVHPNGDILGTAEIEVFGCGPGRLELTLLGKQATPVEISANGRPELTVAPATDTVWNGSVPSPGPADNGRCTFDIRSPGLVGSTRIEFVAAAPEPTGA